MGLTGLNGEYDVFYADPAWRFKSNSEAKPGRNPMRHYKCITPEEIAALPVKEHVTKNCALFLWITGPFLAIGAHVPVMKAWGFKPSSIAFTWVKTKQSANQYRLFAPPITAEDFKVGPGLTTLQNAEFCILGKRGRSLRQKPVFSVIAEPIREHSRKPAVARQLIRDFAGPNARVAELFSRFDPQDPLWHVWGNETGKFGEAA